MYGNVQVNAWWSIMVYHCPVCKWSPPASSFSIDPHDIILHERTHKTDNDDAWCCGCGETGVGMLIAFPKHITDNPNINHKEHHEELHHDRLDR